VTASLLLALSGASHGEPVEVRGQIVVASDLTDRGVQLGPTSPFVQGEVSALLDRQWSASLAAGTQHDRSPNDRVVVRLDRYWALSNDWQADAGLRWYDYRQAHAGQHSRYVEFAASVGYRDLFSLGTSAKEYTPRWPGGLHWALDAALRWPIALGWSLDADLGRTQLPTYEAQWYRYAAVGIGWQRRGWSAGLSRIGADSTARDQFGSDAQFHWTAFVAKDF